ncbi:MAG TPA: HAMP domain-containing sensor histidine kinase [Holophagaceae bacterium]|nr:HAMP domain-containing sensor histidine kinase [Holophagaceae bacterium]
MDTVPHAKPGSAEAEQGPDRVMVVDDSATARLMVEGLLRESGFDVVGFGHGEAALAELDRYRPDLIVLDILMPGLDGLEVCRRLRSQEAGRSIPVLFLTADERSQTQAQAIEVGGDDLVYKPALQRELVIRARSLLRVRKLQVALERESRSLRELQISQEGLFRFIVHDLKSPLQAITSGAELLAEDPVASPASLKMAGIIKQSAQMMERMVQDILVVTHNGDLTPHYQPILIQEAFAEWTESLRPTLTRKGAALKVEIPVSTVVLGDRELLRRCVLNLLDNALKYGPKGGEVTVKARLVGEECVLCVADQGPGIPPGQEAFIFDPFARLDRDVSMARVSSGLGLAFCREVAHAHGGRIWVEPGSPVGSVFCLALPLGDSR